MNTGCDYLKNRRPAGRLAARYVEQISLPKEVRNFKILSINRAYEVSGHFLATMSDKNGTKVKLKMRKGCCRAADLPVTQNMKDIVLCMPVSRTCHEKERRMV
jgi:uncharacterized protein YozE (UPF0346 family)